MRSSNANYENLETLHYPDWQKQIIVVSDGSTDQTNIRAFSMGG